jgi:hypothetical protein
MAHQHLIHRPRANGSQLDGDGPIVRRVNEIALIIERDEQDVEAAEVLVDGTIGGKSYRFLLDTGAARSSITFDDYTSQFASSEQISSSGVFATSSDDLISVPRVELGPISRSPFAIARVAERPPARANLIGMDLLKDFCCHFYFDENRVSIDAKDDLEGGSVLQELFLDRKFHPYVDVRFGASSAKAVWDTGAGMTIVDSSFLNEHPNLFQAEGRSTGIDSTGTQLETPMLMMSATSIGNRPFPPQRIAAVDLSRVNSTIEVPMDLILGYSTLRQANWWFDFPRRKWAISELLTPQ